MSFRHSEIITCLAKLKSCGLSFRGHSLQEWLWNDIFISLRSFPDGMIWNDNCPHPTGMTGMALEWLDWAQNDGMRRPPKRSFEFPSLSFLPHPVIPASSGNAVSMGISLEWRWNDSGRGAKVGYFPLSETDVKWDRAEASIKRRWKVQNNIYKYHSLNKSYLEADNFIWRTNERKDKLLANICFPTP